VTSSSITKWLKLLIGITIGVLIIVSILVGGYLVDQVREAQKLQKQLMMIKESALLIHNLQIERGLSGGFIGSVGKKFKEELYIQRTHTDAALSEMDLNVFGSKQRNTLSQMRQSIDIKTLSPVESFDGYTAFISNMRSKYLGQVLTVRHFQMRNQLQAYINFMATKEAMGQMRGTMSSIATQRFVDRSLFLRISHAKAEFDVARERFLVMASPQQKWHFETLCGSSECRWSLAVIDDVISKSSPNHFVNPTLWFSRSTSVINHLYTLEEEFLTSFDTIVNHELKASQAALIYGSIAILTLIVVLLLLGVKISRSVEKNIRLLDEYKHAVDRSSIVSKTTPQGVITYVNDQFCEISGYTREELLGKPHNIVRHPDMPKEAFKEMWGMILNKKPWHGVVKNQTKNGLHYWVNVTINPILDPNGNIEEFIAIRNDITEAIHLHEELERTQEDMIVRIGEIGETRSLETGYHVRRVAEYSRILAVAYGLSPEEIRYLSSASPMHDIGKIGIPDNILNKPGSLNEDEWAIMSTHSEIGYHCGYS